MVKDPVCDINVDEKATHSKSEYMNKTYCFCSESCKAVFDKNPQKFTNEHSEHEEHDCCCC